MKLNCLHGFFIIEESAPGDSSRFASRFGLGLSSWRDKFTFDELADPPEYCISGATWLDAAVDTSFAGEPWEIMEANGLVYNFGTGLLVQKSTITQPFNISPAGNYFVSDGLILPGSMKKDGSKIISYNAHFSFETLRFRYSGVTYD